jgi:hypothetical protein
MKSTSTSRKRSGSSSWGKWPEAQTQPAEQAAGPRAGVEQAGCREQGQHELGAGQRCGSKQPVDVAAEAAAVNQDESLAALAELVGELHRDPSAERVPHKGCLLMSEREQQIAQAARVGAE